jgi:hypothetical protein
MTSALYVTSDSAFRRAYPINPIHEIALFGHT